MQHERQAGGTARHRIAADEETGGLAAFDHALQPDPGGERQPAEGVERHVGDVEDNEAEVAGLEDEREGLHRLIERPRQHRGIESHVIGGVVAITARAGDVVDDDLGFPQIEGHSQVAPQPEDALAVGPDFQLPTIEVRQGAAQTDRGVRQIGFEVSGTQGGELFVK